MTTLQELLTHHLLQASLGMMTAGLIVVTLMGRIRPASAKLHRVAWCCVLAQGLILAPFTIRLAWLSPEPVRGFATHTDSHDASQSPRVADSDSLTTGRVIPGTLPGHVPPGTAGSIRQPFPSAEPLAVAVGSASPPDASWQDGFVRIWLAGMVLLGSTGAVMWLMLQRMTHRAVPAPNSLQEQANRIAQAMGMPDSVPVLVHESLGPMLCLTMSGMRIVVPEDEWFKLTAEEQRAVLRHELTHWQRGDIWFSSCARILALLHWFNPMSWWAVTRFDEAAEWACDDSLARRHADEVPAFASALLRLAETRRTVPLGVSAAQGAPLATRLKRILSRHNPRSEDPLMTRVLVLTILTIALAAGLFRVQLVARDVDDDRGDQESQYEDRHRHDADERAAWQSRVDRFRSRVTMSADRLTREFLEVLQTEPGLIVLHDRADHMAEELREDAEADALPDWFDEHFEATEDGQDVSTRNVRNLIFRDRFVKTAGAINSDLEKVRRVGRESAERMRLESDFDRLFHRFLTSDASAIFVYMEEVRPRVRPGMQMVLEATDGLFIRSGDGSISIHRARRDEAQEHLETARVVLNKVEGVRRELEAWADELAEPDDLHKRVRASLMHPAFCYFILLDAIVDGVPSRRVDNHIEGFFGTLEEFTEDTATGLVLHDEARPEIEEALDEFDHGSRGLAVVKAPLIEMSERLSDQDELHAGWKNLLATDLMQFRVAIEIETAGLDAGEAVSDLLSEVLEQTEDSRLRLREDEREEIHEFVQEGFARFRELRRVGRRIDDMAGDIADTEIAEALQSIGGRLVLINEIHQRLEHFEENGLEMWIEHHFDESPHGLVMKSDAVEVIEDILHDAQSLKLELANDDFQRDPADNNSDRGE